MKINLNFIYKKNYPFDPLYFQLNQIGLARKPGIPCQI